MYYVNYLYIYIHICTKIISEALGMKKHQIQEVLISGKEERYSGDPTFL